MIEPLKKGDRVRVMDCTCDKFARGWKGTVVKVPKRQSHFPIVVEFVGVKTTLRGEFDRRELAKEDKNA